MDSARRRGVAAESSAGGGSVENQRHPYFEVKSSFVGQTPFIVDLPPALPPAPKLLPFPISKEALASYRPTPLELAKTAPLLTESDEGVYVDLIGPDVFASEEILPGEKKDSVPLLHCRDARLIVGVIPNVESLSVPPGTDSPREPPLAKSTVTTSDLSETNRRLVERIDKSFGSTADWQHPTKPHLKPVKVYPVQPNVDLWVNRYTQVALEGAEHHSFDPHAMRASSSHRAVYLLQYVEAGKTLKRYSLYEQMSAAVSSRPSGTPTDETSPQQSQKQSELEGVYHHIRDYIVEERPLKHPATADLDFLLSLPTGDGSQPQPQSLGSGAASTAARGGDSTESGAAEGGGPRASPALILPLAAGGGRKQIFEKASAKLGSDARKRKLPLRLSLRDPDETETQKFEQLRSVFVETSVVDNESAASSSTSSSSESEGEQTGRGASRRKEGRRASSPLVAQPPQPRRIDDRVERKVFGSSESSSGGEEEDAGGGGTKAKRAGGGGRLVKGSRVMKGPNDRKVSSSGGGASDEEDKRRTDGRRGRVASSSGSSAGSEDGSGESGESGTDSSGSQSGSEDGTSGSSGSSEESSDDDSSRRSGSSPPRKV